MKISRVDRIPTMQRVDFSSRPGDRADFFAASSLATWSPLSWLGQAWKRISGFFSWVFGKITGSSSQVDPKEIEFFKVIETGDPTVKYRLICGGKATENELWIERGQNGFLNLTNIVFPDENMKSQFQAMLRYILAKERGKGFNVSSLLLAVPLFKVGFQTKGLLKFYPNSKGLDGLSVQWILDQAEKKKGSFDPTTYKAWEGLQGDLGIGFTETIVYPPDEDSDEEEEVTREYHFLGISDLLTVMEKLDVPPTRRAVRLAEGANFVLPSQV